MSITVNIPITKVDSAIPITQSVDNFNLLAAGDTVGQIAYVKNSQGTQWLSGILGGSYYPKGIYLWNGVDWVSDRNAISNELENILTTITQNNNRFLDNEIPVKQASDLDIVIDSTKVYRIDGDIDMGNISIRVPSGGFFYRGSDYFTSTLRSSADNYTMFVNEIGQVAGNVRGTNVEHYTTGTNSKIFDLNNQGNFGSIEFNSCNFGRFASQQDNIGDLRGYRQFRTSDVAFIRVLNGVTFNDTWAGGFRVVDTILLSIPANGEIFKEGTSLIFNGSSFTDLNAISVDDTATVFGFQESNFLIDEGFEINSARFKLTSNPIPNILESSTKVLFKGRGINNTYPGGRWEMTTQVITPLTVGNDFKVLGTTTYDDLVHISSNGNNSFIYDSDLVKDFVITGQIVVDGGANDEISVIIKKFDNELQAFVDIREFRRNVSNVLGGLDIAIFDPYAPITLKKDDRIELFIRNNDDNTNATVLLGSFLAINVRN